MGLFRSDKVQSTFLHQGRRPRRTDTSQGQRGPGRFHQQVLGIEESSSSGVSFPPTARKRIALARKFCLASPQPGRRLQGDLPAGPAPPPHAGGGSSGRAAAAEMSPGARRARLLLLLLLLLLFLLLQLPTVAAQRRPPRESGRRRGPERNPPGGAPGVAQGARSARPRARPLPDSPGGAPPRGARRAVGPLSPERAPPRPRPHPPTVTLLTTHLCAAPAG